MTVIASLLAKGGGGVVRAALLRGTIGVFAAGTAVSAVVFAIGGGSWLGWWGVGLTAGVRIPQLIAAGARRVSGISPAAWIMTTLGSGLWMVYAVYHADAQIIVGSICGITLGTVIIFRTELRTRWAGAPA
jgi:hypothetical protein